LAVRDFKHDDVVDDDPRGAAFEGVVANGTTTTMSVAEGGREVRS
jgi:hypothetical protein